VERGHRVLVVDDSLTARAFHRNLLEAGGLTVHTAPSGERAIALARAASYDAVVCDIGMTPMDGFALTQALKASAELKALPVLLISANDGEDMRERAQAAGAAGFLSKQDCAEGRLLSEVRSMLAGGRR
jgi:CheY-like chemotaxis protein